LCKLFRKLLMS